jgi:hypothetical protein
MSAPPLSSKTFSFEFASGPQNQATGVGFLYTVAKHYGAVFRRDGSFNGKHAVMKWKIVLGSVA